MLDSILRSLLMIPLGLAVCFMLWVFWNFCKASRRPRH
jgi:hypothetical protein